MKNRSPRTMALTFRIWCICQKAEWNLTCAEIAEQMGDVSSTTVRNVLQLAGWSNRLRPSVNYGMKLDTVSGVQRMEERDAIAGLEITK